MKETTSKPNTIIVVLLAIGLLSVLFGFYKRGQSAEADFVIQGKTPSGALERRKAGTTLPASGANETSGSTPTAIATITPPTPVVIHVAGAVKTPGVYKLSADSRVDDAIKSAGGSLKNADLDSINLAAKVEDGSQLFVPKRGDTVHHTTVDQKLPATGKIQVSHSTRSESSSKPDKLVRPGKEFVNINTASVDEMVKLPGVGPSTADKIVQYRKDSGGFKNIEELMDVNGIGEKKFERMKPYVKLR